MESLRRLRVHHIKHRMSAEDSEELGSATKGKEAELIVLGKLLERGFKVYTPMVDTGIDCLVDVGEGNYKEVQVKSREGGEPTFRARKFQPRDNFYFVCFLRGKRDDDFWVLPSKVFMDMGNKSKAGNKEYVMLRVGKEGSESYSELAKYHSNWGILLAGATKEIKTNVAKAFKRIQGEHLTKDDYARLILSLMTLRTTPLGRKEILAELKNQLVNFSKADLEMLKTRPRWEVHARFAISDLAIDGLIEARNRNQYVITEKGKTHLSELADSMLKRLNR